MSEKLRWGVLGTARVVRKTIPALQGTKNGEVEGIASRTEERDSECANKHGISRVFEAYEARLASTDVDGVYIPRHKASHLEWRLTVLEARQNSLDETPWENRR